MDAATTRRSRGIGERVALAVRDARVWLGVYVAVLVLIAFWPVPVDRGARGLLAALARAVPWLTYDVVETTANVLLFVPLGALLALVLRRRRWVVPIALAATMAIELGQALLLSQRTPSLRDVFANTLGAAIGLALVAMIAPRSSSEDARSATETRRVERLEEP